MWILRQIVKLTSCQLKSCSNVTWSAIRRKTCVALVQDRWLCDQAVKQRDRKLSTGQKLPLERIGLNPDVTDVPYVLTKAQQESVTEGHDTMSLEELLLNLRSHREKGLELPKSIKVEDLTNMLNLSYFKVARYARYLTKTERKIANVTRRKVAKLAAMNKLREERLERRSKLEHPWLETSNLMLPIGKVEMNTTYNNNALRGLLFGQKVVIDCSYNEYMDDYSVKLTAKQILFCYYISRTNKRPFSLHICNLDYDSRLMFYLKKLHGGFPEKIPIGIHSKSYLDIFERKKMVYLSPHTTTVLDYNPEDIYIIGGLVDKFQVPISHNKARKELIRSASFPLDQHLQWKHGTKSLCIHHCLNILMDVKNTGDWAKALQTHVPSRKRKAETDLPTSN